MLHTLSLQPEGESLRRRIFPELEEALGAPAASAARITLYLPRQSALLSTAQRRFRLLRMLRRSERLLATQLGELRARSIMRPLWDTDPLRLVDESGLSLAIFHEEGFTGALNLPIDVPERIVVAPSFHIKPIISWLQAAPLYHLVSLTSREVTLYAGTPWSLERVLSVQSPWVKAGRGEDSLDLRDSTVCSRERLRQFFLRAEAEIHRVVNRDRHPIVIAGVSRLHPTYRSVNRDPDLVRHAIHGNVERWREGDLRMAAFEALGKLFEQAKESARQEFAAKAWSGTATDELTVIARAAVRGRVRKMLIASDVVLKGNIHPASGDMTLFPEASQMESLPADDVLDDLAEAVLMRGGQVLCVPAHELPTASPAAAFLTG